MNRGMIKTLATVCGLFALSLNAFALPVMSSYDNQKFFLKAASTLMDEIRITEDSQSTYITAANDIRITIPDDFPAIFDANRSTTEIYAFGSAVDAGRLSGEPDIYFENGDKTVVIPVDDDFGQNEYVVIRDLSMEGFYNTTNSSTFLIFDFGANQVNDLKYIDIDTSSYSDTTEPEVPTNLAVEQLTNTSLKLTWDNPTDLDLTYSEVFRGVNESIDAGLSYDQFAADITEFTDTDLEVGDQVQYYVRVSDGPNFSDNSEIISYTMIDLSAQEEEEEVEEEEEEQQEEEQQSEEEQSESVTPKSFTDTDGHWAQTEIEYLGGAGIINGNPDGSFEPEGTLNRASAAALIYRIIDPDPTTTDKKYYSDVSSGMWFYSYVQKLSDLALVKGNPDGTFAPDRAVNRAEFIQMAINLYYYISDESTQSEIDTLREGEATDAFSDLDDAQWYSASATVAAELGFVNGKTCGTQKCLAPGDSITRAEAAVILYNIFYKGE